LQAEDVERDRGTDRKENHIPTSMRVRASNVRYDDSTGEVFFAEGAFLDVEETVGDETHTFRRDVHDLVWSEPLRPD
jgi:hypothetical protein